MGKYSLGGKILKLSFKGRLDLQLRGVSFFSECDTSEGQAADRSAKPAGLRRVKGSAPVFISPPRQSGITELVFRMFTKRNPGFCFLFNQ